MKVLPVNEAEARLLLGSADGPSLARLFEHGLAIPSETLVANASLVFQRDGDGRRTRRELARVADRLVGVLAEEFDFRAGSAVAKAPAEIMLTDVIEKAGVGASIAVADAVWGTHDADWERIYPWDATRRRQKALDHRAATAAGRFVEVEARGMVTSTAGARRYNVEAKAREVQAKKTVQRKAGNSATMLGVITEFPFGTDEPVVSWVMDPPAEAPAMEPERYKLLARLVYFERQLGLIRKPAMLQALAGRLDAIARSRSLDELDGLPLRNDRGESFRLPVPSGDVVEPFSGVEGRLLPLNPSTVAFYGFDRTAWELVRRQDFAKIRGWTSARAGVYGASFAGFAPRRDVEQAGITVDGSWRTRASGQRIEVPVEGRIAVTQGGYAFGHLRLSAAGRARVDVSRGAPGARHRRARSTTR